jgi:hypothetical protein
MGATVKPVSEISGPRLKSGIAFGLSPAIAGFRGG